MARKPRNAPAGRIYHVLNRSAGKIALFKTPADYAAFTRVLLAAHARMPLPIFDWCLMKNHWHFVVQPETDSQVTDFFRWLTHTHAMRWRVSRRTVGWGHLYQGRFKAFAVQPGRHFFMVARYVQRNALAAGVVKRAEDWPHSSLHARLHGPAELRALLSPWPTRMPPQWLDSVNTPLADDDATRLRLSLTRQCPYGDDAWTQQTAIELSLEHTLRPEGRPRERNGDAAS